MKSNVVVGIPRILFRLYIYLRDKFDPRPVILEEEKICYNICNKLISNPESQLFVAPLSNKRYIKNDDEKMFIVIENRVISIINHVYSYTIYCEDSEGFEQMVTRLDKQLEKKRTEIENEIRSNIRHSLKNILDSMSH